MPAITKMLIFIIITTTAFCSIIRTTQCVFYSDIPRFGNLMSNLTITVGRDAVLACLVENLSIYKVAWLRVDTQTILTIQNHVITKNHRIGVSNSDRQLWRLHVKDTRLADRGWYMCQINTEPMKSQIAYLDVVASPNILDSGSSSDVVVSEGDNVTLICEATGVPPPIVMWRREDGIKIPTHHVVHRSTHVKSSMLLFGNINSKHSGVYMCIASNGVPPTVSKRIPLIVEYVPKIYIPQSIHETDESSSVELACYIEAFPKPESYWAVVNGSPIINGTHFNDTTFQNYVYRVKMKLIIPQVSKFHYGVYLCVSKNSVGTTEEAVKIYGKQTYGQHTSFSPELYRFNQIIVLVNIGVGFTIHRVVSSIFV